MTCKLQQSLKAKSNWFLLMKAQARKKTRQRPQQAKKKAQ
jgi:hypothetical protein